jgi:predicted permease
MPEFLHDVRFALRSFKRSAGLTAVIVASLAIGIGANTGVFSVVNALLLKPLPYPDPDRLAVLWLRSPGLNIMQDWPSPGQYIDLRRENRSFEKMSISQGRTGSIVGLDQPEPLEILRTSSGLFDLLGATPLYGRLLLPEDDKPGGPPVAILSYALWQRMFHSDPSVVGRSVTLNGVKQGAGEERNQFTIAGVLRPEFLLNAEIMPTVASTLRMDVFVPLPLGADAVNRRGDENYNLMARLKSGVSFAQAQSDVSAIAARIREKDKRDKTFTISVVPLLEQVVGDVRRAVLVLLGSVALVLLIACANVANLLLSRSAGRQKEVAIRTALGANWGRIVAHFLTESVLLAVAGGAAGLLVAKWSLYVLRTVNPGNIPRLESIIIDARVLLFTFAVAVFTGILFGLAPAWRSSRLDLNSALRAGTRNAQADVGFSISRHGLRSALVVVELALSIVLLIGAGLLIRTFVRLQSVSPGFNPDHVISMRMGVSGRSFASPEAATEFYRELCRRVASAPGVLTQGVVTALPFTSAVGWGSIGVEGWQPQPGQELQVDFRVATPEYFRAMQIPLVQGRYFIEDDARRRDPNTVIIDDAFAKRFWPKGDAIGKHLWMSEAKKAAIVGVVGNVKQYGADVEPRIVTYWPGYTGGYLVARAAVEPSAAAPAMVREIHALVPSMPVYDIRSMDERMRDSLGRRRFSTIMLSTFAVFALILAAVGVYGVMSYLVSQGAHEIGLRMALGAEASAILRFVLARGLLLAGIGIVAGIAGALAATRVMSNLLFGVGPRDWATFTRCRPRWPRYRSSPFTYQRGAQPASTRSSRFARNSVRSASRGGRGVRRRHHLGCSDAVEWPHTALHGSIDELGKALAGNQPSHQRTFRASTRRRASVDNPAIGYARQPSRAPAAPIYCPV